MSEKVFSRLYQVDTITSDNTYIYCTNGSSISRINISSKEIIDVWNTTLITSKYNYPQKIYYFNNVLYATNNNTLKSINVVNGQTNGIVTTIGSFTNNLFGMVIYNNNLYVSDETYIYKLSLSDNTLTTFATKTSNGRDYLVEYNGYLYVSSSNNNINRYNLTTETLDSWALLNLSFPKGIVINNGILYILNLSNNTISSVVLSGTTINVIQNVDTNNANDLICVNNTLYIANTGSNNILSYDTNTELLRTYLCGLLGDPYTNSIGICNLNNKIYISNYNNDSIYKIDNTITSFNTGIFDVIGMCCDSNYLYVSSLTNIYKLDTDGYVLQTYMLNVQPYNMVITNNLIYFTSYSLNKLYSYNITTNTTSELQTLTDCVGITLLNNNLYIGCSDGLYIYNIQGYSKFIDLDVNQITNDGTYLYFSSNGNIYKSDTSGIHNILLYEPNDVNGLLYTNKLYYIEEGIVYSYVLTPMITSLNPEFGTPGSTIIINGLNLTNVNTVYFGDSSISYTILSDNTISIIAPSGNDNINIYVSSPTGISDTLVFGLPTSYTICFVAGTRIQTDQGKIPIEKINICKHTIHKQKIVAITKTVYETEETLVCFEKNSIYKNYPKKRTIISRKHKILHMNSFKEAETFINKDTICEINYNGEILYNVLLEKHYSMRVHNMVCETLHPQNKVALFYKQKIKEGISADEMLIQFKKLIV